MSNPTSSIVTHLPPEQLTESILQKEWRIAEIVTCGNSYCPLYEGIDFYCS